MPDATIAACHIASLEHPITALAIGRRFPRKISKRISMPIRFSSCTHTMRWYRRFSGTSGAEKYRFCQHRRCLRFQCPKCHRTGTAAAVRARLGFDSGRLHHGCQARCFAPTAAGHHCTAANNRRANADRRARFRNPVPVYDSRAVRRHR